MREPTVPPDSGGVRPLRVDSPGPDAYGEAFADVYDEWYSGVTDAEATAEFVACRAGRGPVLELGVGTGRLAAPLARRGLMVVGVDASPSMLTRCSTTADEEGVARRLLLVRADMTRLPFRPHATAALIAFNTLFNLTTVDGQAQVFRQLSRALAPGGAVIVEALDLDGLSDAPATSIGVRALRDDGVTVIGTSVDADRQRLRGRHVDVGDRGVDVRSWDLRWATVEEIDAFAAAAGYGLSERYRDWDSRPYLSGDDRHVSVYRSVSG